MASESDLKRYRENLREERGAATLYRKFADAEPNESLAEVYRRLAETEDRHANLWASKLREAGVEPPEYKPGFRTKLLAWVARRFGVSSVLPSMVANERRARTGYDAQPEARQAGLPADERSHARIFSQIARSQGGLAGPAIAQLEGRHRGAGGNALRAAVLGANDGLVSNLSLVMGVAGAELSGQAILVAGFAGLMAGAMAMAMGEWLSVQSARELYSHQIAIERDELAEMPEEEAEELALIYQAKGIPAEQARAMANQLIQNPENALDTLVREELAIDPEELGGSAWVAAGTSFLLFAGGAIVPILGFLFASGWTAVILSLALTALALFFTGAATTLFTGRSVWFAGARQAAIGLGAAAVTFAVGKLFGVVTT